MNSKNNRIKRQLRIFRNITLSIVVLLLVIFGIYVENYYHADSHTIAAYTTQTAITKEYLPDDSIVYRPENTPSSALILYPGGKVEHTAYEPLMLECADRGILCVLVKMPFRLAVFDINAADKFRSQFPYIDHWFIGGHSLGGAMASSYLSKHSADYEGLILLASYASSDLSNTDLRALSIYGSCDQVLNHERYEENAVYLPADYEEHIIPGGCHAYFGTYGFQKGDGIPTISNDQQISISAEFISSFISAND